jgi:hypothetical protein
MLRGERQEITMALKSQIRGNGSLIIQQDYVILMMIFPRAFPVSLYSSASRICSRG